MPVSHQFLARLGFSTLATLLVAVVVPAQTRASLVVTVNSTVAMPGGTGSFDVVVSNTNTTGTFDVSGFSLELQVPSNSGVKVTSVNVATTTHPYIFGTLQSPPFSSNIFPTTDFIASDSDFSPPGFVTVMPGASFGLEHVTYSVAAGITGTINVSIVGLTGQAPTSQIDDINGSPMTFTPVNGTIVSSTPEPSALMICGAAALILALRARQRGSAVQG